MEAALDWMVKGMGDITENSRIAIKVGSIAAIVVTILLIGRWWGAFEQERTYTAQTLAKHDERITRVEDSMAKIQLQLQDIATKSDASREALNTAVRNTTFLVDANAKLQVALAERGITVKGD